MTTGMRILLLVLVVAAVALGIWFGIWLFDRVTEPDAPLALVVRGVPTRS